jgi:ATP-dependent DNA ligase
VRPDGVTSFALLQAADAAGDGLVFFVFHLLYLGANPLHQLPLRARKAQLAALIGAGAGWLRYVDDHHEGDGPAIYQAACRLGVEGIVSKPADAPYLPGDRRAWLKVKCLNREEFVVVGWSEPEGHRHRLDRCGSVAPNLTFATDDRNFEAGWKSAIQFCGKCVPMLARAARLIGR